MYYRHDLFIIVKIILPTITLIPTYGFVYKNLKTKSIRLDYFSALGMRVNFKCLKSCRCKVSLLWLRGICCKIFTLEQSCMTKH